jgi:hypothetical protein
MLFVQTLGSGVALNLSETIVKTGCILPVSSSFIKDFWR